MPVDIDLQQILDSDELDSEFVEKSYGELIDEVIDKYGWAPVYDFFISVLRSDNCRYRDWFNAANLFCEAAYDRRPMDKNLVIGLVYQRLKPDEGGADNNLAWTIACELKEVSYVYSDYDPMSDPDIIAALAKGN